MCVTTWCAEVHRLLGTCTNSSGAAGQSLHKPLHPACERQHTYIHTSWSLKGAKHAHAPGAIRNAAHTEGFSQPASQQAREKNHGPQGGESGAQTPKHPHMLVIRCCVLLIPQLTTQTGNPRARTEHKHNRSTTEPTPKRSNMQTL